MSSRAVLEVLLGTSMTFSGFYFFFRYTDLFVEFSYSTSKDFLTYFWNKPALKI